MSPPAAGPPAPGPSAPGLPDETEVLVAGAGPVGLFAALLLAREGIRPVVIDEQRRPAAHSYALALHPRTLGLLREAGLLPALAELGHPVTALDLFGAGARRARLTPSPDGGDPPFLLVVPQRILEELLAGRLAAAGVPVLWNHRLSALQLGPSGSLARIERLAEAPAGPEQGGEMPIAATSLVRPAFVLGTDGHGSLVRRSAGIALEAQAPPQDFALFEVAAHGLPETQAALVAGERTVDVLWPLGGGRFRWTCELEGWEGLTEPRHKSRASGGAYRRLAGGDGGAAAPAGGADRRMLGELLAARAPWLAGEVGEVVWSTVVRFEHRLAERFGRGPAWLAGDAAHLAGPIATRSLNLGLWEARELAARLVRVLCGASSAAELEEEGRARRREWRRLFAGRAAARPGADPWIAAHAARLVRCLPASGAGLDAWMDRLGLDWVD